MHVYCQTLLFECHQTLNQLVTIKDPYICIIAFGWHFYLTPYLTPTLHTIYNIWSVHSFPGNRPHDLGVPISGYLGVFFFRFCIWQMLLSKAPCIAFSPTHWSVPGNGTHELLIELQECSIFFYKPHFVCRVLLPSSPFLIQYGPFLGWFGLFWFGIISGPHGTLPAELGGKALQVSVESQRPSFTEL